MPSGWSVSFRRCSSVGTDDPCDVGAMRAGRWRRFLERDQLFNDAPIDRTFCLGVRGNLLQIAGRVGRFDAGGGRECLKFCRRDVILVIADNLANPREVEGLPDTRSVGFVLLGEGCVPGVDARIEHRPNDVLATHVEQGVRGIGLHGRDGSVERCRRDAIQRDLKDVAVASRFFADRRDHPMPAACGLA